MLDVISEQVRRWRIQAQAVASKPIRMRDGGARAPFLRSAHACDRAANKLEQAAAKQAAKRPPAI